MLGRQFKTRTALRPSRIQIHSQIKNSNFTLREYATKKKKSKKVKKLPRLSDPVTTSGLEMGKDFTFDQNDAAFKRLMHLGYLQKHTAKAGIAHDHDPKKFNELYNEYDHSQTADDLLRDAHLNIPRLRVAANTKRQDIKRAIEKEKMRIGTNDTPFLATLNRDLEKVEQKTEKAEKLAREVSTDLLDKLAPEKHDEVYADRLARAAKKISPEWFAVFDDPYRKEEQDALVVQFREWLTNHSWGTTPRTKLFAAWLVHVKGRDDIIAKIMKINLMAKLRYSGIEKFREHMESEYYAIPEGWEEESPLGPDIDELAGIVHPHEAEETMVGYMLEDIPNFTEVTGKQYAWDAFSHNLAHFYENIRDTYRTHKREKKHALRRHGRVDSARVPYSRPETVHRTAIKIRDGFGPITPQMEKSLPNDALVEMEKIQDSQSIADNTMTGYGRDSHESAFPKIQKPRAEFEEAPIFGDEDYFEDEEDIMHWDEGMHFYPFDTYVVERGSVTNITNKGRVNSSTVLLVYGNYHGTCGWGYGKGTSEQMAMENARTDAIRNLISAPAYVGPHHTIPHAVYASFGSAHVSLHPSNKLSSEPFLGRMCELFGIEGVRVRSSGRRNKRNLLRAFFKAIMELRDDYDIAIGMGRQLPTDLKRYYYETANAQYKRGIHMYN